LRGDPLSDDGGQKEHGKKGTQDLGSAYQPRQGRQRWTTFWKPPPKAYRNCRIKTDSEPSVKGEQGRRGKEATDCATTRHGKSRSKLIFKAWGRGELWSGTNEREETKKLRTFDDQGKTPSSMSGLIFSRSDCVRGEVSSHGG